MRKISQMQVDDTRFGLRQDKGQQSWSSLSDKCWPQHLAKKKNLYLAFVGPKKAFDTVPYRWREVMAWTMIKSGVNKWLLQAAMEPHSSVASTAWWERVPETENINSGGDVPRLSTEFFGVFHCSSSIFSFSSPHFPSDIIIDIYNFPKYAN